MCRLITFLCLLWGFNLSVAVGGTYALSDGNVLSGEPISFDQNGVVIKSGDNTFSPRTAYDKFTQEGLRRLMADAQKPSDKAYLEGLIEEAPQAKAKRKEIVIKPVTAPERPTKNIGMFAAFSSPIGIVIFLILYGATIFAAYEVAVFRNQPFGLVCGLAAVPFLGVVSPIVFVFMPTRRAPLEQALPHHSAEEAAVADAPTAEEQVQSGMPETVQESAAAASGRPALPAPIVFKRGEFTFHRRFFETKLAGFLRVVPSEAEKDLLLHIKSVRGEFVGRRVVRIGQNEFVLQVFKDGATADEQIPFAEVLEVQIRHKDLA